MKRFIIIGVAGFVGVAAFLAFGGKPLPAFESAPGNPPRGAYHIHTELSPDSDLRQADIEAAAVELGLDFIILTDHDKQAPGVVSRNGLTIFSFSELRTPAGHLVQLGSQRMLEKVERKLVGVHTLIRRLGGVPVVSHPTDLRHPWQGPIAEAGGVEIANIAASARRRAGASFIRLLPAVAASVLTDSSALVQFYDRDDLALSYWDWELDPGFIGLCAADLHGRIDLRQNLSAWELVLVDPLPEDEASRADSILDALKKGRFFCNAGLLGRPRFEFFGIGPGGSKVRMGDSVTGDQIRELIVLGPNPGGGQPAELVLIRDGIEVARRRGRKLHFPDPASGTYRAEVRVEVPEIVLGHRSLPVIYSNKIRVLSPTPSGAS